MVAYLTAQFVDVRLFHFWKGLTKGRHLWLRNNASTVVSQLLDSVLVVLVLFYGVWGTDQMLSTVLDLWLFKALCALADTPLFYFGTWWLKRTPTQPLWAGEHGDEGRRGTRLAARVLRRCMRCARSRSSRHAR